MEQIHMSNPANMTAGSGMTSGVKGQQQSVDGLTGTFQMGHNASGMMDFKGLLQGQQFVPNMTEEQEQTASLLVAEMQSVNNLLLLGMPNMQTQGGEQDLAVSGEAAESIVQIGVMKLAQSSKAAAGEVPQNEWMQNGEAKLDGVPVEHETAEGVPVEQKSDAIQSEMSKELPQQMERQAERPSDAVEKDVKDMTDMLSQETTLKQQLVLDGKAEQPKAHDVIKAAAPQEIPKALSEKIVEKTNAGVREFEIQIEPKHLGKIAVKVEYQNGDATISIICSESKTLEIVKQNVGDISTVVQKNLQEETIILVDEKTPEAYEQQQGNGNSDAGRESEWERQREQRERRARSNANRFLQELRLGLTE